MTGCDSLRLLLLFRLLSSFLDLPILFFVSLQIYKEALWLWMLKKQKKISHRPKSVHIHSSQKASCHPRGFARVPHKHTQWPDKPFRLSQSPPAIAPCCHAEDGSWLRSLFASWPDPAPHSHACEASWWPRAASNSKRISSVPWQEDFPKKWSRLQWYCYCWHTIHSMRVWTTLQLHSKICCPKLASSLHEVHFA